MERLLLDKLPLGQGQPINIEDHWRPDEVDRLVVAIAELGADLRTISQVARDAHEAGNVSVVRAKIAEALVRLQANLLPMYGADVLWPVCQVTDLINEARKGKRHWLVTFKGDEPHIPRNAPYRKVREAMGAAALHYFSRFETDLGMTQSEIAQRIADAMHRGGFQVRPNRLRGLSDRTVQDWRNSLALGKRPGRKEQKEWLHQAFSAFEKDLAKGRGDTSVQQYFKDTLIEITERCRHQGELFESNPDVGKT